MGVKKTYKGIVTSDPYGYRVDGGYVPSLTLECKKGEDLCLGAGNFGSVFSELVGKKIKLTIEEK